MDKKFYDGGLSFSCTRCSSCCRHESGYVYLSENDLSRLAHKHQMGYTAFVKTWCRWIPFEHGRERLALKEKSNYDCIFWAGINGPTGTVGCSVYDARPLQCRTFPFWDSVLCSAEAWKNAGAGCPGINNGKIHDKTEIEEFLRLMEDELIIERETPRIVA